MSNKKQTEQEVLTEKYRQAVKYLKNYLFGLPFPEEELASLNNLDDEYDMKSFFIVYNWAKNNGYFHGQVDNPKTIAYLWQNILEVIEQHIFNGEISFIQMKKQIIIEIAKHVKYARKCQSQ